MMTGGLRASSLGLTLLTAYLALVFSGVSHEQLLRNDPVVLPLIGVALPLLGFFAAAPFILLLAHLKLLLDRRLAMAGPGDHGMVRPIGQLGAPERQLLVLLTFFMLALAPLAVLFLGQIAMLPYHHPMMLAWHRLLITVDLAVLWLLWPKPGGRLGLAVITLPLLIAAFGLAVLPGERLATALDRWIGPASSLPGIARNLAPVEKSYALHIPGGGNPWEDSAGPAGWGLDLEGRDLRHADLVHADLRHARLGHADLRFINLERADLRGADLRAARLQGAQLFRARLQNVSAWLTEFQGADLRRASFQGAYLRRADLRGAWLWGARLEGASAVGAALDGADLSDAVLAGADLAQAHLRGASLRAADLDGTTLAQAKLEGADLREASLKGADLREARLWRVLVGPDPGRWAMADLRGASFSPIENAPAVIEARVAIAPSSAAATVSKRLRLALLDETRPDPPIHAMPGNPEPDIAALARFLGELACNDGATPFRMLGIARRISLLKGDRELAPSVASRLLVNCPPASALPDETRRTLQTLLP